MQVIRASAMGMCFGVRDALVAAKALPRPQDVTIYGELVHNGEVQKDLEGRGFSTVPESGRRPVPRTPAVLITAHGISDSERKRLADAGKDLIDTTCPLVRQVHRASRDLERSGYLVIVIGRRGHIEVEGIIGDLERFAVVDGIEEVESYPESLIGVVCQSTTRPDHAAAVLKRIIEKNPGKQVRFVDTICTPTRERQQAVLALLAQVEALVVVGGSRSNNTLQLAEIARSRGVPCFHVQTACELDPGWFSSREVVGLTAGTSTLESTIDEVHRALLAI